MSSSRRLPVRTVLAYLVLGAVVAVALYVVIAERPFGFDLSRKALMAWVKSLGPWGGLGIVFLMIAHSFIPFPAEIVAFIAGEYFGLVWGTVYAWTGAMIGAVVAFALARFFGRAAIDPFLPRGAEAKLDNWAAERSANALLLARFIPVIAFNLINYAAGLTHVRWWTFIWTTGLGILPLTVLFVYLGVRMRDASWQDWVAMAAVALLLWGGAHLIARYFNQKPRA